MNTNSKTLRFAIFGNEYQPKKSTAILTILSFLEQRGAEIYIDRPFYDFLQLEHRIDTKVSGVFDGNNFDVDYVISMGGDGTFLKAATRVGPKQTPIIGVNMGRLGFLADVMPSEVIEALDAVYKGHYVIDNHAAIMVQTEGELIVGCPYALNDIAVLKRDNASMIAVHITINGEYVGNYLADGIIVATPTGSTAYSLSNGGPIIVPQSSSICITPVAPHSLSIRPIVIRDDSRIELKVDSRTHNFLVAVDGRSQKMTDSTLITITKAGHNIQIVRNPAHKYFTTLREKMMWGADQR